MMLHNTNLRSKLVTLCPSTQGPKAPVQCSYVGASHLHLASIIGGKAPYDVTV